VEGGEMNKYTFKTLDGKKSITVEAKNYPLALEELTIEKFRQKIFNKMEFDDWDPIDYEKKKEIEQEELGLFDGE
jgi:hypothetical protein